MWHRDLAVADQREDPRGAVWKDPVYLAQVGS